MVNEAPGGPRLLFVMDNDFGALGVVMYLLHGQAMAANATLLLPRRIHALHEGQLAVSARPYDSLRDILDFADAESPRVAFLVSGYLFARQQLLSIGELRGLVDGLRKRGCRVATSDPYLGTFREMAKAHVVVRTGAVPQALRRRLGHLPWLHGPLQRIVALAARQRLVRHVRQVSAILSGVAHFYPARVSAAQARAEPFCFFNPRYIRGEEALRALRDAARPRWLFVLAGFDYHYQEAMLGKQRFVELVAARIREALRQGRHPTFVGPAPVIEALAASFAPDSGVTLVERCGFAEFERMLLDAEVAFYWQVFSTSAFVRLWNGLPVFSFDAGHTAQLSEALHQAGLEHYFMGRAPRYLDLEQPLDAAALATSFEGFRESAREAIARLAPLPTPPEMVEAILDAAPRGPA